MLPLGAEKKGFEPQPAMLIYAFIKATNEKQEATPDLWKRALYS